MNSNRPAPVVSIIVPCRNEAGFIARCLDSILLNGYPADRLDILVVDGESDDGTRAILDRYAAGHACIRVIDNRDRCTPHALNRALTQVRGAYVLRVDAHSSLLPGYIAACLDALAEYHADVVGGRLRAVPTRATLLGRCIVAAISHPFGVGNSYFRTHSAGPKWVDTVFCACYRREVFDRVPPSVDGPSRNQSAAAPISVEGGPFNVRLARGQDMEFHLRLKRIGGRILLIPTTGCQYYIRSDFRSFWTQSWNNGAWAIRPFAYCDGMPIALRHLTPLLFVSSVLSTLVSWSIFGTPLLASGAILAAYGVANMGASLQTAWREQCFSMVGLMPIVFLSLHVGYGLGSLWGVVMVVRRRLFWRRMWRRIIAEPAV